MFDQIAMASEALQASVGAPHGTIVLALSGCLQCQTIAMIAGPALGRCVDCGEELSVLDYDQAGFGRPDEGFGLPTAA